MFGIVVLRICPLYLYRGSSVLLLSTGHFDLIQNITRNVLLELTKTAVSVTNYCFIVSLSLLLFVYIFSKSSSCVYVYSTSNSVRFQEGLH